MKNIFVFSLIFLGGLLLFTSCQKEISNETGVTQIAEGSLSDSLGNCSPDSVVGTFYTGITPGKDTAYVQIQVNVTKVGSYTIESNLQNGFQFADSGFFTTTGLNTVLLKPIGTPILPVATTFSLKFDSSLCNFTVNVLDSTGTGIHSGGDTTGGKPGDPDTEKGSWQFTSNNFLYGGNSLSGYVKDTAGGHLLVIGTPDEVSNNELDTSIYFIISIPSATITPGTYTSTSLTNPFIFYVNDDVNGVFLFQANFQYTSVKMTVVITSYDATTKVLKGTFTGTATDENETAVHTITGGSFSVVVQ